MSSAGSKGRRASSTTGRSDATKGSTDPAQETPGKHRRRWGAVVAAVVAGALMGGAGFGIPSHASAASAASAVSPASPASGGIRPAGLPCGHRVEATEGAWVRENPDTNSVKLKWKAHHDFIWWDCDWSQVLDKESGVWFQPVKCACASDDVGWMPASAFD